MSTMIDIPVDALLGDWRERLSPAAVLDACREQLTRVDVEKRRRWRACEMIEALYHPGRYIRIGYVLLDDPHTPAERRWPEGQVIYLHAPLREPMSRRGEQITLGSDAVEAYGFPNDRRLRGLRHFAARQAAVECWQRWLRQSGDAWTITPDSLQRLLVRYVPEQKWIVRLRAAGCDREGAPSKRRLAIRAASPASCARLAERHTALARCASESDGLFVVPRMVGLDHEQGLLGVEWIRGDSLERTLREHSEQETLSRVAGILRSLHAARIEGLEACTADALSLDVGHAVEDLSVARPALAGRLSKLGRELVSRIYALPRVEPATIHNDFHWNQLHIKRDRFVLLDLERVALGDPWLDVANFVTQLRMLGVRGDSAVDAETANRWADTFLACWTGASNAPVDDERMNVYAALSRLNLARGMMRHLRPGWAELAEHCVAGAQADLSATPREALK